MADEGQAGPSGQGSGGGGGNGSGVLPIGTGMGSHPPSLEEPLPSSAQLQAAIDQITHLQRVLVGDDHMSLDELLAATAASGPSQGIPAGGMTRALPALLGPLLPLGGGTAQGGGHLSHEQTNVLFARRTAFQPRQYMAMAAELVQRTQAGEGSASSALALSDKIFAAAQQGGGHGTGNKLAEETLSLRERVLQNRKRKRIAQGNMSAPQSLMQSAKDQQELISASSKSARARSGVHRDQPSSRMTTTPAPFLFPGEQNAKIDGLGQGVRTLGRPSQDDLDVYLSAWYAKLQEVDVEASLAVAASVDSFASGQQACQATIRVEVACMGTAWVTVGFRSRDSARGEGQQSNEWGLRVESFNVRSETEVVSDECQVRGQVGDKSLVMSAFPLYRRLTAELQTKALGILAPAEHPWHALAAMLFAAAGSLAHLHERDSLYEQGGMMSLGDGSAAGTTTIPRGPMAVFEALRRWAPNTAKSRSDILSDFQAQGAASAEQGASAPDDGATGAAEAMVVGTATGSDLPDVGPAVAADNEAQESPSMRANGSGGDMNQDADAATAREPAVPGAPRPAAIEAASGEARVAAAPPPPPPVSAPSAPRDPSSPVAESEGNLFGDLAEGEGEGEGESDGGAGATAVSEAPLAE